MSRTVCVVVTARPSYSRIRTALSAIAAHPDLELQLVVAASALLDRYGNAVEQIEADGFHIDEKVYMVLEGEDPRSMAKTTGIGMVELATTFDNLRPDVVVTIADRYETLATATAAAYMNIPLVHVQGGEVTGSIDEKVRHAVTKLADLHLVATEQSAQRVRQMGEDPAAVIVTGCPSIDLAAQVAAALTKGSAEPFDPLERYQGVGAELDLSGEHLVVLQHPVTTQYDHARAQVTETLRAVHELDLPTLWFWPNVDAGADGTSRGIRAFREEHAPANIRFFKNMAPTDFLTVLTGAACLVGNSSAGIREAALLGVPVVNIGGRQEGRERGANVLDAADRHDAIRSAIEVQMAHGRYPADPIYGDGDAGERIAAALAAWTPRIEKRLTY